jgi:hypothetical protein
MSESTSTAHKTIPRGSAFTSLRRRAQKAWRHKQLIEVNFTKKIFSLHHLFTGMHSQYFIIFLSNWHQPSMDSHSSSTITVIESNKHPPQDQTKDPDLKYVPIKFPSMPPRLRQ